MTELNDDLMYQYCSGKLDDHAERLAVILQDLETNPESGFAANYLRRRAEISARPFESKADAAKPLISVYSQRSGIRKWPRHILAVAAILVLGVALGFLIRGSTGITARNSELKLVTLQPRPRQTLASDPSPVIDIDQRGVYLVPATTRFDLAFESPLTGTVTIVFLGEQQNRVYPPENGEPIHAIAFESQDLGPFEPIDGPTTVFVIVSDRELQNVVSRLFATPLLISDMDLVRQKLVTELQKDESATIAVGAIRLEPPNGER